MKKTISNLTQKRMKKIKNHEYQINDHQHNTHEYPFFFKPISYEFEERYKENHYTIKLSS